ncbi:AraC family transcriptional regulator [Phreatobacter stygius]|uniref:AraC family transcriptional regulator n=1 Tax=Phreatobacter stygius TaxID=1940610 RepID=A0A4D7B2U7_9HYPH|nr:helix-turn-helix transcriptional regulator [Phreatobacter stygius]QCI63876.1 AraC family transcriptional regulator [Phreatobacter stygius]
MKDVTPTPVDKTPDTAFEAGIGVLARRYPQGTHLALHRHETAQLIFAVSGTMQVTTPTGRWLVPPERAVWVPARFAHAIDMLSDVEMRSTYVAAGAAHDGWVAAAPGQDRVIAVSGLLRALILAQFDQPLAPGRRRAVTALLLDEVARAEAAPTFVPMPKSPAMIRLAESVVADPAGAADLADLAARAGTSVRTASRLFPAETALTFKAWRQRARIMAAIQVLGRGVSVKEAARSLGFSSSAAFGAAFRSVTGKTPGGFFEPRP